MNMSIIRWWFKPSEKLPANKEQVLVRFNGFIELAFFDADRRVFVLKNGTKELEANEDLEWMETLRAEGL